MMKYWKNIILIAGVTLFTAACSQEESLLDLPADDGAIIRIIGGQVGYSSRAFDDEPKVGGQCNADRLIVYQYERHEYGAEVSSPYNPSKMDYKKSYGPVVVDHYSDNPDYPSFQSNKWVRQSADLPYTTTNTSSFAFPAIAYSDVDENKFNVGYEGTLDMMKLSLEGNETPEIYFGRVEAFKGQHDPATGIYREYKTSATTVNKALSGKLYRVVSQINVRITNVNPELVERMTMELSNVPTEIGLYADHRTAVGQNGSDQGFHYPIVAATADQQNNGEIVVCETSEFRKGVAELSTFLLPSKTGRSLNIHIYFKEPIFGGEDEEGNPIYLTDKSYEVRPPKSYYIPVEVADAYYSQEPLPVYNVLENLFYSYSNVRVNINGDFDNFFPDKTDVDVDVEICPRYDNEHNYGDGQIDYTK